MKTRYQKLVRDLIPDVILANGGSPNVKRLPKKEFLLALQQKLEEEVQEFLTAKTKVDALEELADIVEVVEALALANGFSAADVQAKKKSKKKQRGGFEKRLFLVEVEEN